MQKDTTRTVARQAARFLSGTMLSRISGLLRDMTMAFCFGASAAVAAFMIAFRLANLLRRALGEGAMQSAFVPQFETMRRENSDQAAHFFKNLSIVVGLFLFLLIALTELGLGVFLAFFSPSPDWREVIVLTMLSLPCLLFICLYGLFGALLQCERRFFLPSVAPVFSNLVWILAAWLLKDLAVHKAMQGLALAIIVAYAAQWLVVLPAAIDYLKNNIKTIWTFQFKPLKGIVRPLLLGILGVSAAQINSSLDPLFARSADLEGPAYLWYAIRLQQLPLALFGIALANALLPSLSRARQQGDMNSYGELLSEGLFKTSLLMIPLSAIMIAVGGPAVNLLFGHGDFTSQAVGQTTWCLWGYALGLLPMTLVLLYATAFYSQSSFQAPFYASLISMIANVAFNSLFVFVFDGGAASIAFATSLAAFINWLILAYALKERGIVPKTTPLKLFGLMVFSLIAAGLTLVAGHAFLSDPTLSLLLGQEAHYTRSLSEQLITLLLEGALFAGLMTIPILSNYFLKRRIADLID